MKKILGVVFFLVFVFSFVSTSSAVSYRGEEMVTHTPIAPISQADMEKAARKGIQQGLGGVNKNLKKLKEEVNKKDTSTGKTLDSLNKQSENLSGKVQDSINAINKLGPDITNVSTDIQTLDTNIGVRADGIVSSIKNAVWGSMLLILIALILAATAIIALLILAKMKTKKDVKEVKEDIEDVKDDVNRMKGRIMGILKSEPFTYIIQINGRKFERQVRVKENGHGGKWQGLYTVNGTGEPQSFKERDILEDSDFKVMKRYLKDIEGIGAIGGDEQAYFKSLPANKSLPAYAQFQAVKREIRDGNLREI